MTCTCPHQPKHLSSSQMERIVELAQKRHPDWRVFLSADINPVRQDDAHTEHLFAVLADGKDGEQYLLEEFTEMLHGATAKFKRVQYFVIDGNLKHDLHLPKLWRH